MVYLLPARLIITPEPLLSEVAIDTVTAFMIALESAAKAMLGEEKAKAPRITGAILNISWDGLNLSSWLSLSFSYLAVFLSKKWYQELNVPLIPFVVIFSCRD